MAVTQDAAGESTGKPASFQGLSLFWGASVWTEGRRWKDERKKERKKEGLLPHVVLQFDFIVKSFLGIVWGEKHGRGLLHVVLT